MWKWVIITLKRLLLWIESVPKSVGTFLWGDRAPWRQKHKADYYFALCLTLNKPCMHIEKFFLLYTNVNILLLMLCAFHFFFNIFCISLKWVYYDSYGHASCRNVSSGISLGPISSLHNQQYFSSMGPCYSSFACLNTWFPRYLSSSVLNREKEYRGEMGGFCGWGPQRPHLPSRTIWK